LSSPIAPHQDPYIRSFLDFVENTVVQERNLPEKWGPIEPTIWEPAVDRVPRSEQIYGVAVMHCCGAAVGKATNV